MKTFDTLVDETVALFQREFNNSPKWIAAAPGRVNLIGEHVDYNDGFVLPMAIDRYTVVAAGPGMGDSVSVHSAGLAETKKLQLDADSKQPENGWSNYLRGVIAGFAKLHEVPPLNAVVHSNVPLGSGLSSSAALEVAFATMLNQVLEAKLDPEAIGLLCQTAEHEHAGVPCGIMDQFSSALCRDAHLLLLDCRSQTYEHIPFSNPDISVLITNSEVKHSLVGGEYAARRSQCESATKKLGIDSLRDCTMEQLNANESKLEQAEFRRARHVVTEIERVIAAAKCFSAGQWPQVGKLMYESHASLDSDYEVSCGELNTLVEIASQLDGVIGSRMTGGGFGGCTVSLVEADQMEIVKTAIEREYESATGIQPTLFSTRPAQGAHVVETFSVQARSTSE
jgi:galactokinase